MIEIKDYKIIDNYNGLEKFYESHRQEKWMSIDTEFIGERRFQTLLCLIQIASPNGLFLIDPLKIDDLSPLLTLVTNPDILKISHAGENDYRLFYELYGIVPKNIFDTQIAAGFVGYGSTVSFRGLAADELGLKLSKSQAVTDWDNRPVSNKQIKYALSDVVPLRQLYEQLTQKIERLERQIWVQEELEKLEVSNFYERDPYKDARKFSYTAQGTKKEQLFIIRLFAWRRKLAEERNHSEEMILSKKNFMPIVKGIRFGIEGLKQNRRVSNRFISRYGQEMERLYDAKATAEEEQVLNTLTSPPEIEDDLDMKMELLYSFITYRCVRLQVAPDLVMPRRLFKEMKANTNFIPTSLEAGWRRTVLGEQLYKALLNRNELSIAFEDNELKLKF